MVKRRRNDGFRGHSFPRGATVLVVLAAAFVAMVATITPAAAQDEPTQPGTTIELAGDAAKFQVVDTESIQAGLPGAGDTGPIYDCRLSLWRPGPDGEDGEIIEYAIPASLNRGVTYYLGCNEVAGVVPPWANELVVYDPDDPTPGTSSIELARWIDDNLIDPPALGVGISPEFTQITGVESWLWPDGSTVDLVESAHAGALSLTMTATYQAIEFDMGDESDPIFCDVTTIWAPGEAEPACAHTYLLQGDYVATGTTHWRYIADPAPNVAGQPDTYLYADVFPGVAENVPVLDLEAVITR